MLARLPTSFLTATLSAPRLSAPFALEVANAIPDDAQGGYEVNAHSPVTGKDYTMKCRTEETYTTCTGGVAAEVHILR